MFKIENEMDLHCKVVHLIRNYYPNAIIAAGLGGNQDTPSKRINSWKKGYTKGQPDLMILNYHKDYNGLCIEFKSATNIYQISDAQKEMKERSSNRGLFSNHYDANEAGGHRKSSGVVGRSREGSSERLGSRKSSEQKSN